MNKIEKHLTFNREQSIKIIDSVFSEEKNDAHRYNPFFLIQKTPLLNKVIEMGYQTSASFKKITG